MKQKQQRLGCRERQVCGLATYTVRTGLEGRVRREHTDFHPRREDHVIWALGMADTKKHGTNEMGSCQRKDHSIWALKLPSGMVQMKGGAEWCSWGEKD